MGGIIACATSLILIPPLNYELQFAQTWAFKILNLLKSLLLTSEERSTKKPSTIKSYSYIGEQKLTSQAVLSCTLELLQMPSHRNPDLNLLA
jgi:hypothetical protein